MTRIALLMAGVWILTSVGCCHHGRHGHATFAVPPACPPGGICPPAAPVQPFGAPAWPHGMNTGYVDPQVQLHEHYQTVDARLHSVSVR